MNIYYKQVIIYKKKLRAVSMILEQMDISVRNSEMRRQNSHTRTRD